MIKILKNTKENEMQDNIVKAHRIIDEYLPFNYVDLVLKKLPAGTAVTKSIIRNVKKKHTLRVDVLNAMLEVAFENKAQIGKLKKLTK